MLKTREEEGRAHLFWHYSQSIDCFLRLFSLSLLFFVCVQYSLATSDKRIDSKRNHYEWWWTRHRQWCKYTFFRPGHEEDDADTDWFNVLLLQCDGQADKRAHHNALERKRRDHIKDSFSSLRDSIPSLHGEKVQVCESGLVLSNRYWPIFSLSFPSTHDGSSWCLLSGLESPDPEEGSRVHSKHEEEEYLSSTGHWGPEETEQSLGGTEWVFQDGGDGGGERREGGRRERKSFCESIPFPLTDPFAWLFLFVSFSCCLFSYVITLFTPHSWHLDQ